MCGVHWSVIDRSCYLRNDLRRAATSALGYLVAGLVLLQLLPLLLVLLLFRRRGRFNVLGDARQQGAERCGVLEVRIAVVLGTNVEVREYLNRGYRVSEIRTSKATRCAHKSLSLTP